MAVLNIAIVGEDGFARSIAKPSDHRDVDTYVHKTGTGEEARILSLIRPTRYPERLRPLLTALGAARAGVLQVRRIDAAFGESLVAFAAPASSTDCSSSNPRRAVGSMRNVPWPWSAKLDWMHGRRFPPMRM